MPNDICPVCGGKTQMVNIVLADGTTMKKMNCLKKEKRNPAEKELYESAKEMQRLYGKFVGGPYKRLERALGKYENQKEQENEQKEN